MLGKLNANAVAHALKLPRLECSANLSLNETGYGHLVAKTIRSFAYSDQEAISDDTVPLPGYLEHLSLVAKRANDMWHKMEDSSNEQFPLGHDGYFKLWSLSKPTIETDYCLLDEAQDSNPALLSVLKGQSCQVVFVGDRFQQIYEWRGAENAMETIATPDTLLLSQSFRFGEPIAHFASQVIQLIDPSAMIRGNPDVDSTIGCGNPDAILSRTNASLIAFVMDTLEAGRKPFVIGGVAELKWMLEDVKALKRGRSASHPEFFGFQSWHDVLEFVKQPEGEQLFTFVSIVERYGEETIITALNRSESDESQSDIVLSTAHKAKGLEWPRVMLADDFTEPSEVRQENESKLKKDGCIFFERKGKRYAMEPEEIRILYVAATRGKLAVHLPMWCTEFFDIEQLGEPLIFSAPTPVSKAAIPKAQRATVSVTPQPNAVQFADEKSSSIGTWVLIGMGIVIAVLLLS